MNRRGRDKEMMKELAEIIRQYGDIELLATEVEAISEDDVKTMEDLLTILEAELEYLGE